ncbi:MAG TPA: DUF494 domain-containing protein [Burkholderiales bacterium]|jgi:Smg protein|nr:DUF494 domain-containing protein [Burkholderiales bacterium]
MFDILVYLIENYFPNGDCPDAETLSKRLCAAGFEEEDIAAALAWLSGLESPNRDADCGEFDNSRGFRVYTEQELARTTPEARGFLVFLENSGMLSAPQRELIIERVTALEEPGIGLEKLKLVALLVLWNQKQTLDPLVVEELLAGTEERQAN